MTIPVEATSERLGVSIVLCTYNGEGYLHEQLESLLAQTRPPDEIIVVDDASDDSTWPLLLQFCERAKAKGIGAVLKRNRQNLGYVRNFESAVALAQMPLVFLCDQDDVWHSHKIERMEAVFRQRQGLLLLHTDARLVDRAGDDMQCGLFEALEITRNEISRIHAGAAFEVLLRRNTVTGATTAFRREVLGFALPFPKMWVHDEWIAVLCAANGEIDCLEEQLIDYRQHGNNQIGVRKRSFAEKLGAHNLSRREHMRVVEMRLRELAAYFIQGGPRFEQYHHLLVQRIDHAHVRANLPTGLFTRFRWVSTEARTGRYHRHSFGLRSIVADILGLD